MRSILFGIIGFRFVLIRLVLIRLVRSRLIIAGDYPGFGMLIWGWSLGVLGNAFGGSFIGFFGLALMRRSFATRVFFLFDGVPDLMPEFGLSGTAFSHEQGQPRH
ncbi:MAG: hypothetical protein ACR2JR_06190, partial [Rubrobacteraceae bacterium]